MVGGESPCLGGLECVTTCRTAYRKSWMVKSRVGKSVAARSLSGNCVMAVAGPIAHRRTGLVICGAAGQAGVYSDVVRFLAIAVTAVVVLLIVLWTVQRQMMYFPSGSIPAPAEVGLTRAEVVTFTTDDGVALSGWFVPAERPGGPTVIVFNGNAGNRAYRSDLAARFSEQGMAVLLFDYRGYGGNAGSPTEEGLALDARAAHRYVLSRGDVDARRLVYFGESLGSAVAVRLATEHPPAAVVLRSPFTSFVEMGRLHFPVLPVRWILRDRYPSIDRITQIGAPLLVVAGSNDTIVPASQSRRLFEAAREPKRLVIIEGADHNDEALNAGPRVIGAVVEFVRLSSGQR